MCCPTVCPAHCITIIPAESDDHGIEKRPAVFEIDELRCVVCGMCVEACPCDAIRMDTGEHVRTPVEDRADAIETKESMMARGVKSIAKQGGEGPNWRAHDAQAARRWTARSADALPAHCGSRIFRRRSGHCRFGDGSDRLRSRIERENLG